MNWAIHINKTIAWNLAVAVSECCGAILGDLAPVMKADWNASASLERILQIFRLWAKVMGDVLDWQWAIAPGCREQSVAYKRHNAGFWDKKAVLIIQVGPNVIMCP